MVLGLGLGILQKHQSINTYIYIYLTMAWQTHYVGNGAFYCTSEHRAVEVREFNMSLILAYIMDTCSANCLCLQ